MADERQTKHDGREPDRVRAVLGRYIRREDLAWPSAPRDAPAAGELREYFRGCLLWGAVGDALGRPAEGHRPEALRKRFGLHGLQEFVPWYGWRGGPKGTFTDDTQLTMAVAESLLALGGTLSPDDLARRFVTMRSRVRGIGHATKVALGAMERGTPWWEAGDIEQSAGNGAAMRAAPVGLLHALNPSTRPLVRDAVLSAVPTHTHPVGVAGAVAVSAGVAWCARARAAGASALDVDGFVDFVCGAIAGIESEPTQERKPGGEAVRLVDRLRELPNLLTWPDPEEVFAYTYNGAFALESVPAALYCFLRSPDDPRHVLLTAVNAGYDADTVASMAGNLAGAWNGAKALERVAPSWWADLEDRDGLSALADRLADLALAPREPSGPQGAETMPAHRTSRRTPEHFAGCLLGGAVGDALGAAVEFKSLREIRRRFGPDGIRDYAPAYGRLGAITDDTQMTLFTAEGLIRADNRFRDRGICHPPMVVYHAYQRWLDTQGQKVPSSPYGFPYRPTGWLVDVPALRALRAPGNTCISSLRSGRMGTIEEPLNDSKGCGGVMRVAPVGLVANHPFGLGCEVAALTHGHPSGFPAAGFLSALIAAIVEGQPLARAIGSATEELRGRPAHEECLSAVEAAVRLAAEGPATPQRVERLGGGWVAGEALAISLYCALTAEGSFERGVLVAVNHGGDSDSTGAITGNILGALLGKDAIPPRWLEPLELRAEIEQVALDLYRHFGAPDGVEEVEWEKYPPW